MKYENYKEVPLILFLRILKDGKRLGELNGVDKDTWEQWMESFEEENPTKEQTATLARQHSVMKPDAELQLYRTLVSACMASPSKWEYFFEQSEIKPKKDLPSSIDYLKKMTDKKTAAFNVRKAEWENFLEQLKENKQDLKHDMYDTLANIGVITGQQYRYQTITVGEFLAAQRLAEKISKQK